jgi:NDP-sugar pyrophosphorylase family protein
MATKLASRKTICKKMIGKAFIPAAGLGTRLGDLSKSKPKALAEVDGIPMLELTIERLKKNGIRKFVVNVHHFGDEVIDFIKQRNNFGVDIQISDERSELLDTGGAILKAATFFDGNEPVLVHNVDVISEVDFKQLAEWHQQQNALVSLCVRKRKSGRALLFNDKMFLKGWANLEKNEFKWVNNPVEIFQSFAFSGIYLFNPDFAKKLPYKGKFSIIDAWLKMAKTENILGFHDQSSNWFDLGTTQKIKIAEAYLAKTLTK